MEKDDKLAMVIQKYQAGEISLERSARIAGVSVSRMMDLMREFGVIANLETEDYLQSLKNIRKVW